LSNFEKNCIEGLQTNKRICIEVSLKDYKQTNILEGLETNKNRLSLSLFEDHLKYSSSRTKNKHRCMVNFSNNRYL